MGVLGGVAWRNWLPSAAQWPSVFVLAIAYFLLAKLGLELASLHPSASPVWPPSGLALAAFLLWGKRVWPAITVGRILCDCDDLRIHPHRWL